MGVILGDFKGLKNKILLTTAIVILLIIISAKLLTSVLSDIEESFDKYTQNATTGQITLLEISRDLNYISSYTQDIILGGDYDSNLLKIKNKKQKIELNFEDLHQSLLDTTNEKEKINIYNNAKKYTLLFIDDVVTKVVILKEQSIQKRYEMYPKYKEESTPLAVQSRNYFTQLTAIKLESFEILEKRFYSDIKTEKKFIIAITILLTCFLLFILPIALKSLRHYFESQAELENTTNLLKQYKTAMDATNIVSKTDLKGRIIFVNDKFCEVSQFSQDELIGKPHNIVRSVDTPKSAFKNMWSDIQEKKIWKGMIKNIKKDGTHYYVDTTIIPILDNKNKIKEYIAIRKDITEIIDLNLKLASSQEEILSRMGMIAETKSKETGYHVKRVAEYCKILATALELDDKKIDLLYNASALHDMGKVGIPDHILHKPGKLTDEEFDIMRNHSKNGYDMLRDSKNEIVKAGAIIALQHHEKYDGSGYPNQLKGNNIHIFGRITALADVFDALGENRSYKKAWELKDILDFIKDQSGKHFDPLIVDAFFKNTDKILFIRKKFRNHDLREN